MAFKRMDTVPKGRLVPMYLADDGSLYSLRYKDLSQLDEVSEMMGIFLSGVLDSPLVIDNTPVNDVAFECFKVMDKREKKN